jgi:hypothetical protein
MNNDKRCYIYDTNNPMTANHSIKESTRADARSDGEGEE